MEISTRKAECHDQCLLVEGPNGHFAEVVESETFRTWLIDCDSCGTCVQAGFGTREEALIHAVSHVSKTPEEYWADRNSNKI